jgi:hypothetical protein
VHFIDKSIILLYSRVRYTSSLMNRTFSYTSVADPDPPDPHVFGPPESGSGSISQRYGSGSLNKNGKKNHVSTVLRLLFDFLSLKNDVNVRCLQKLIGMQENFF